MKYLEPKAPTSKKFYAIDYSKLLQSDTIKGFTIAPASGTVLLSGSVFNASSIGFFLTGGVSGETATFNIGIVTEAGQQFPDVASINVIANEYDIDFSVITKNQIIKWAWEDLRLSGYIFDHTPDENAAMLARLDGLMRELRLFGSDPGYNHPTSIGMSNLNDVAGIPDGLGMFCAVLLAKTYMDGKGKSMTPSFIAKYTRAKNMLYAYCKGVPNRPIPAGTPHGAGMIQWSVYFPFFYNQEVNNKSALLQGISGQIVTASLWDASIWNVNNWN